AQGQFFGETRRDPVHRLIGAACYRPASCEAAAVGRSVQRRPSSRRGDPMIEQSFVSSALAVAVAAALARAASAQPEQPLEEIVVTGTYVPRASQFDSPSPLVVVGRDDIVAAGANEIGELIEDLTINTG